MLTESRKEKDTNINMSRPHSKTMSWHQPPTHTHTHTHTIVTKESIKLSMTSRHIQWPYLYCFSFFKACPEYDTVVTLNLYVTFSKDSQWKNPPALRNTSKQQVTNVTWCITITISAKTYIKHTIKGVVHFKKKLLLIISSPPCHPRCPCHSWTTPDIIFTFWVN